MLVVRFFFFFFQNFRLDLFRHILSVCVCFPLPEAGVAAAAAAAAAVPGKRFVCFFSLVSRWNFLFFTSGAQGEPHGQHSDE